MPLSEAIAQQLITTNSTHSAKEQAALLGINYGMVKYYRSRLIKAGRLDPGQRAHHRPYTREDKILVEDLVSEGMPTALIAKRIGRTPGQVEDLIRSCGLTIRAIRQRVIAVRTLNQIAALFGVCYKAARKWVAMGWLKARRASKKTRHNTTVFLITDEALMAFLDIRAAWPSWDPDQMTDPVWRQEATERRRAAKGQWVRLSELALRLHYTAHAIAAWLNIGSWDVESIRWGYWRYVWVPDSGLPPCPPNQPRPVRFVKYHYPFERRCKDCGITILVHDTHERQHRVRCEACRYPTQRRKAA